MFVRHVQLKGDNDEFRCFEVKIKLTVGQLPADPLCSLTVGLSTMRDCMWCYTFKLEISTERHEWPPAGACQIVDAVSETNQDRLYSKGAQRSPIADCFN